MKEKDLRKLISTTSEIEVNIIKEILEEKEIGYLIRNKGAGSYMRIIGGSSVFATDFYVRKEDYLWAQKLLEENFIGPSL